MRCVLVEYDWLRLVMEDCGDDGQLRCNIIRNGGARRMVGGV